MHPLEAALKTFGTRYTEYMLCVCLSACACTFPCVCVSACFCVGLQVSSYLCLHEHHVPESVCTYVSVCVYASVCAHTRTYE